MRKEDINLQTKIRELAAERDAARAEVEALKAWQLKVCDDVTSIVDDLEKAASNYDFESRAYNEIFEPMAGLNRIIALSCVSDALATYRRLQLAKEVAEFVADFQILELTESETIKFAQLVDAWRNRQ